MYQKYETVNKKGYSIIDNLTGECFEFKEVRKVSYDEFLLVFLHSIPELCTLQGKQLKMLLICWQQSTFNPRGSSEGNIVHNDTSFKKAVRDNGLDLSDASIDVYISQLVKKNLLIKVCRGAFMLNPKYFFKGTHKDAMKLSLSIEFDNTDDK